MNKIKISEWKKKKLNKIEISNSSGKQLKVTVVKMLIGRRLEEHSKNFK